MARCLLHATRVAAAVHTLLFTSLASWADTKSPAGEPSIPVAAMQVTRETLVRQVVSQGEFRPFQEIEVHAKVAGYLASLAVDVGDRVEAGQVIATIEVPELDQDLRRGLALQRRAEQDVVRATSVAADEQLSWHRLETVNQSKPNLISQQDLDSARNKSEVAAATLAAAREQVEVAREEVNRLRTMAGYARITAPFAGVITKRYADPGAMIPAGTASSSQALPLVRLSENARLRFAFPISVPFVSQIKSGTPVEIRLDGGMKPILGQVARFTRKVELATRTMEVEVDVPNPDLAIIPGIYASAWVTVDKRSDVLTVPVEAISRAATNTVWVINSDHRIEERALSLGLETPSRVEVLTGVKENEWIAVGARSKASPGQLVEPKPIAAAVLP